MARGHAQQIFRVAPNVELGVGMDAGPAEQQQAGAHLFEITGNRVIGLAVEEFATELGPFLRGDGARDLQVRLVNLGEAVIDDVLVKLLLLLETEGAGRLLAQHPGDFLESNVMKVRVVGGHRMDRSAQFAAEVKRRLERAERARRAVQRGHQRPVAERPPGIANHQEVDRAASRDPFAHRADDASRCGAQA